MEAGGEYGDFGFGSSSNGDEFLFGDEQRSNDNSSPDMHGGSESPDAAEHFLGEGSGSTMSDDFGSHDEGSVEQVPWALDSGVRQVRTTYVCGPRPL
jgi:hypothetical protein